MVSQVYEIGLQNRSTKQFNAQDPNPPLPKGKPIYDDNDNATPVIIT